MAKKRGRAKRRVKARAKSAPKADAKILSLARELKISRVQVWRLVQRGMPTSSAAAARAWRAENVETKSGAAAQETQRLRGAQARIAEMQARKLEGELAEVAGFEASIVEALVFIRTEVEGKAGRLAQQLAGMGDAAEIRQFLLNEFRTSLNIAADRLEAWARLVAGGQAPAAEADQAPLEVGRGEQAISERKRGGRALPQ